MAKKTTIKINGHDYPIRFGTKAMEIFEGISGLSIPQAFADPSKYTTTNILTACHVGILEGARITSQNLPKKYNREFLADAEDEEPGILDNIFQMVFECIKEHNEKKEKRRKGKRPQSDQN